MTYMVGVKRGQSAHERTASMCTHSLAMLVSLGMNNGLYNGYVWTSCKPAVLWLSYMIIYKWDDLQYVQSDSQCHDGFCYLLDFHKKKENLLSHAWETSVWICRLVRLQYGTSLSLRSNMFLIKLINRNRMLCSRTYFPNCVTWFKVDCFTICDLHLSRSILIQTEQIGNPICATFVNNRSSLASFV